MSTAVILTLFMPLVAASLPAKPPCSVTLSGFAWPLNVIGGLQYLKAEEGQLLSVSAAGEVRTVLGRDSKRRVLDVGPGGIVAEDQDALLVIPLDGKGRSKALRALGGWKVWDAQWLGKGVIATFSRTREVEVRYLGLDGSDLALGKLARQSQTDWRAPSVHGESAAWTERGYEPAKTEDGGRSVGMTETRVLRTWKLGEAGASKLPLEDSEEAVAVDSGGPWIARASAWQHLEQAMTTAIYRPGGRGNALELSDAYEVNVTVIGAQLLVSVASMGYVKKPAVPARLYRVDAGKGFAAPVLLMSTWEQITKAFVIDDRAFVWTITMGRLQRDGTQAPDTVKMKCVPWR